MKRIISIIAFLAFIFSSCTENEPVDLIVHNAKIYTVNALFDISEAMVIKDGKIIAIGPEHEIMNRYYSPNTVDAKKRPIYPLPVNYKNSSSEITNNLLELATKNNTPISFECYENDTTIAPVLKKYALFLNGTNDKRWSIINAELTPDSLFHFYKNNNIIPVIQSKSNSIKKNKYLNLLQLNGLIVLDINKESNALPSSFHHFLSHSSLSRKQLLKGMTIWTAIANFEENDKGSLEVGKDADFIILNNDIMITEEKNILATTLVQKFITGKNVFTLDNAKH